jgi:hypothetical protein
MGIAIFAIPAPSSAAAASAPHRSLALPFGHDFSAGLDQARAERKPVFVEAWAPW